MPQCMGALFPYQINIARTDIPAAAWNNPSWLSNKKDSNSEDEELPGGKDSPH